MIKDYKIKSKKYRVINKLTSKPKVSKVFAWNYLNTNVNNNYDSSVLLSIKPVFIHNIDVILHSCGNLKENNQKYLMDC